MSKYIVWPFVVLIAALLGNYLGDQATLSECATTGKASLLGRVSIECSVTRKAAP